MAAFKDLKNDPVFLDKRKKERLKTLPMIFGSYQLDSFFIALYAMLGIGTYTPALMLSLAGFLISGFFMFYSKMV